MVTLLAITYQLFKTSWATRVGIITAVTAILWGQGMEGLNLKMQERVWIVVAG